MGVTNLDNGRHQRYFQMLVTMDDEGREIVKMMQGFGDDDAVSGHGDMKFTNVRVSKERLTAGVGMGCGL